VVDRWHLLYNLREKLQEVLPRLLKSRKIDDEQTKTPSYAKRKKYFKWVNYLHAKGYSQWVRLAQKSGIILTGIF